MAAPTAPRKPRQRISQTAQKAKPAPRRVNAKPVARAVPKAKPKPPPSEEASSEVIVEGPPVEINRVTYVLNPNLTDGLLSLVFVAVDAATDLKSQREAASLLSDVFAPGEFLRMTRNFLADGAVPMDEVIESVVQAIAEDAGFPTD